MSFNCFKNRTVRNGFTLIELILIIFISATIFAGVLPLIAKTTTANKAARLKLLAYQAANNEIENMRGTAISELEDHNFSVTSISGATGSVTVDKDVYGETQTDIAAITSTVTYVFKGKTEEVELITYLYGT